MTRLSVLRTTLTVTAPDARPALVLDDVRDVTVKRLSATGPSGDAPVVWLRSTRDCLLDAVQSPEAVTVARLSGERTASVHVAADAGRRQRVVIDPDVDARQLRLSGNVSVNKTPTAAAHDQTQVD